MIAELQAAIAATKTAFGIAATIQKISTDAKINEAVIEIQSGILEAQSSVMAANDRIRELSETKDEIEKEFIRLKDWRQEASRYKLNEIVPGILFYTLKEDQKSSEPQHYLCPQCFVNDKKSILQKPAVSHLGYKCHQCGFEAETESPRLPTRPKVIGGLRRDNW